MIRAWDEWDDDWEEPLLGPLDQLVVDVTDNPVTAVLFGLDGAALIEITERAVVPFGFQRPASRTE